MQKSETPIRLSNEAVVNEVVAQAAREYEYRFLSPQEAREHPVKSASITREGRAPSFLLHALAPADPVGFSFLSPCAFAPRLAHAGRGFFF